jgi:uncharacterized protein (DUF58 family)
MLFAAETKADSRTEGVDIYILLDKSKSMAQENKLKEAREWLAGTFIANLVIPGDKVTLLEFYGKAEPVWHGPISSENDKKRLIRSILSIKPNGAYTDIGNALDQLQALMEKDDAGQKALPQASLAADASPAPIQAERKKYVILITDEKQEAPKTSQYYSPDGSFKHSYLTYTKKEPHGAWFVITLGIGIDGKVKNTVQDLLPLLDALPGDRGSLNAPAGTLASPSAKGALSPSAKTPNLLITLAFWATGVILILIIALLIYFIVRRLSHKKEGDGSKE